MPIGAHGCLEKFLNFNDMDWDKNCAFGSKNAHVPGFGIFTYYFCSRSDDTQNSTIGIVVCKSLSAGWCVKALAEAVLRYAKMTSGQPNLKSFWRTTM